MNTEVKKLWLPCVLAAAQKEIALFSFRDYIHFHFVCCCCYLLWFVRLSVLRMLDGNAETEMTSVGVSRFLGPWATVTAIWTQPSTNVNCVHTALSHAASEELWNHVKKGRTISTLMGEQRLFFFCFQKQTHRTFKGLVALLFNCRVQYWPLSSWHQSMAHPFPTKRLALCGVWTQKNL